MIWLWIWLGIPGLIVLAFAIRAHLSWRTTTKTDMVVDHGRTFAAYMVAGVLFGALILATLIYTGDRIGCRNKAHNIGIPWRYSLSTGCLYQVGGTWFPSDQIRMVNGQVQAG